MNDLASNSSFSNSVQFAWDATSLTSFMTCPRRYQYEVIEGWQKKDQDHLIFGLAYANALESYYVQTTGGEDPEIALRNIVRGALIETKDWVPSQTYKTRETLIRSIVWYFEHFKDDPTEVVVLKSGKPAVELSFSYELDDGIFWCGHIDRLVNYNDHIYVMDQKTTRYILSSYYFQKFNPHQQMSGYTFSAKTFWSMPVKGVIIDAAQIKVGSTEFARGFTSRTDEQLEEWYNDTMYWIKRAMETADSGYFPQNPEGCDKYGGCPFRETCSVSPKIRPNYLKRDFGKRESWDPLKRR